MCTYLLLRPTAKKDRNDDPSSISHPVKIEARKILKNIFSFSFIFLQMHPFMLFLLD
jgi:hypothetical protein